MGKNKKKSKSKQNILKGQSDGQSSGTQKPKESGEQIDIESKDISEQEIENTKDSEVCNSTKLSEESNTFVEDTAQSVSNTTKLVEESDSFVADKTQSDMKRGRSSAFKEPDSTKPDKRRTGMEFPNSKKQNYQESNESRGSTYKSSNQRRSEPFKRTSQTEDRGTQKKRFSYNENNSNWRGSRDSSNSRRSYKNNRDQNRDEEFFAYQNEFDTHKGNIDYVKTKEVVCDLFEVPDDYSLAHCVAEDMNMGAGIAVQFRYEFKRVGELLNQNQNPGGLAVLKDKDRYIYYLVTKRFSSGKPTYRTLFSSLKRLRAHVVDNSVKKIAMPRIGCGLDRLEWDNVKFMVEFLFRDVDIEILVCNLEPTVESPLQKHRNCKVTNETYPIEDIEKETVILYFSSEDEFVSDEMRKLDEKFHFLNEFKYARKSLGKVVFFNKNKDYLLCGCIVRKSKDDPFDFVALQKCLNEIQKENRKNNFYYYAFQAIKDKDSCLNYKIINILRNNLRNIEVYVCWPGDLQNDMTPRDRFSDRGEGLTRESSFHRGDRQNIPLSTPKLETKREWTDNSWANEVDQNDSFVSSSSPPEQTIQANSEWFEGEDQQRATQPDSSYNTSQLETQQDSWEIDDWKNPEPLSNDEGRKAEDNSFTENINHEYESFQLANASGKIACTSIKEEHPSNLPSSYSRVCYAREDLMINNGIPQGSDVDEFVGKLLNQNEKAGGVAYLKEGKSNFLYCLIISAADGSPSTYTIFSAIQKLRDLVRKNNVKKLVIPRMDPTGCDLKWSDVQCMFQYLLGQYAEMSVATFKTTYNLTSLTKKNRNKITHSKSPIHQMKKKSAIIYLASVEGVLTDEMKSLTGKFDFKEHFQTHKKSLGDVIKYKENEDHALYGCIVKNKHSDRINFEQLQKCLKEVNAQNIEKLPFVGIQAVFDRSEGINFKIATLMVNCLQDVTITMCWPGDLRGLMPGKAPN